ncbi:glycosyltransferase family 2 protein, partial [Thomasclavelia cocleata]
QVLVKDVLKDINDDRLIILTNETNLGVTKSRNKAMEIMSGEFMAVMDADDISDKTRFEKEVKYLQENSNCDLVSCQMAFLTNDNRKNPWIKIPKSTQEYLSWLFWDNSRPFPHGPAMIRNSFLNKNAIVYDENYKKALDYRLWVDCARHDGIFHILDEYLYLYRVHSGQISQLTRKDQIYFAERICLDQLQYLKINPTETEEKIHLCLRDSEPGATIDKIKEWKNKIILANEKYEYCDIRLFKNEVNYRYFKLCYKEFLLRKNKEYRLEFIKSLSFCSIYKSIKAICRTNFDKKHAKTLKV